MKNKTIGYVRVSTLQQDADGQELELLRYATYKSLTFDKIYKHSISSTKSVFDRELDTLEDELESGDKVIFSELSRIARNTVQTLTFINTLVSKGVEIHVIKQGMIINKETNDPFQKAFIGILATIDQLERDTTAMRTKERIRVKMAEGQKWGRPLGSTGKSKLDPHEDLIRDYIEMGVAVVQIAKKLSVSRGALINFMKKKGIVRD